MDRTSAVAARLVIENICPSADARRAWIGIASRAIEAAASVSREAWETTLFEDRVRLNVGQIAVLDLFIGGMALCVEGQPAVRRVRGIRQQTDWPAFAAVRVPTERWIIAHEAATRIPSELLQAHLRLVQTAAMTKGRSPFRKSHSAGVVAYLRAEDQEPRLIATEPLAPVSNEAGSSGFADPEISREVEMAAVTYVTNHYTSTGWDVRSVETSKIGYDLRCAQRTTVLHVEVKGCSSRSDHFILTAQELRIALSDDRFVLALVDDIRSGQPRLRTWTAASFRRQFELQPQRYWAVLKSAG